eukprot:TRINITY_DN51049_c0_g1_i1.p1 TRINITY_DN51049_c0_g1~~TRINITY_DN51049_c0_g1_i1.p1  ORF type:complete len:494 (+),score=97.20 TRINITY_DN51049_c0_g1_i1:218-1483(+)
MATVAPRGGTYPLWSDAAVQMSIQQCLQGFVQPQLDEMAQRLASLVEKAQNEQRDLEKVTERGEMRNDARFVTLESQVAILNDASARMEQRERDLNEKIAGFAQEMLRNSVTTAANAKESEASVAMPRLLDLEHRNREILSRLDRLEEVAKKVSKTARQLDERTETCEARMREVPEIQQQIEEIWSHCDNIGYRQDDGGGGFEERLAHLEEQVCTMNLAAATAADSHGQQAILASNVQQVTSSLEALQSQVNGRYKEIARQADDMARKLEEANANSKTGQDQQKAFGARLDDINLRLGQLKVKTDSLEGRVMTMSDRVEASRRQSEHEEIGQRQFTESCRQSCHELEERVEVFGHRLEALSEDCGDLVEQALERRLAVLAGAAPASRRSSNSSRSGVPPRLGTPSRPLSRSSGEFLGEDQT